MIQTVFITGGASGIGAAEFIALNVREEAQFERAKAAVVNFTQSVALVKDRGLMAGRLWRHQSPFMREFCPART